MPRLVRALSVLWAYSASIETVELRHCALTPSSVALLCAALSGIDRRSAHTASRSPTTGLFGGGLRSLTIACNDSAAAAAAASDGHSGAWHIAQWLRTKRVAEGRL